MKLDYTSFSITTKLPHFFLCEVTFNMNPSKYVKSKKINITASNTGNPAESINLSHTMQNFDRFDKEIFGECILHTVFSLFS